MMLADAVILISEANLADVCTSKHETVRCENWFVVVNDGRRRIG